MINIKKPKTEAVLKELHVLLEGFVENAGKIQEEIVTENRVFSMLCREPNMAPGKCARLLNERYGYDLTGYEIIQIFKKRRMANQEERKELLLWADEVARDFAGALTGRKDCFEKFEKKRKETVLKSGKKHASQERLAAIAIYTKYPEIDTSADIDKLHLLGNTLAKYFFFSMADAVANEYGYRQNNDSKEKKSSGSNEKKMTYEQALRRVEQLEKIVERNNTLLQDLQEEREEELEASKEKGLTDFFKGLNSEKYGCLLDQLLVTQKNVDQLRKNNFELPLEINGLLILVKKLIQFVRDSHIEPIMKVNSVREVVAADVEYCSYEGSPFQSPEEKKTVRVVSPGWIYKDKEIQISRPKVKEEVSCR